jgi:hypothetical protein
LVYLRIAEDISIRQTPPASFYQQPETHYSVSPTDPVEHVFRREGLKTSVDVVKPFEYTMLPILFYYITGRSKKSISQASNSDVCQCFFTMKLFEKTNRDNEQATNKCSRSFVRRLFVYSFGSRCPDRAGPCLRATHTLALVPVGAQGRAIP